MFMYSGFGYAADAWFRPIAVCLVCDARLGYHNWDLDKRLQIYHNTLPNAQQLTDQHHWFLYLDSCGHYCGCGCGPSKLEPQLSTAAASEHTTAPHLAMAAYITTQVMMYSDYLP